MGTGHKLIQGTATAVDGAEDAVVIAAQGVGTFLHIQYGFLSVHLGGADAGGKAALEDGAGGTRFVEVDADAATGENGHPLNWGERGFRLSENTALNLTVDGDGTTEASARVAVVGWVAGV